MMVLVIVVLMTVVAPAVTVHPFLVVEGDWSRRMSLRINIYAYMLVCGAKHDD